MNSPPVDEIARAVLYEGYNLYPYRPSVKSRHRWTFGGLYPHRYSEENGGSNAWSQQTQCLVEGGPDARLAIKVRFLHLTQRTVGRLAEPLDHWPQGREPLYEIVNSLQVGSKLYSTWQEAVERQVSAEPGEMRRLVDRSHRETFSFPMRHELQPLPDSDGRFAGVIVCDQEAIDGSINLAAEAVETGLYRITVRILNHTPLESAGSVGRDGALLRAMVSTHTILSVEGGQFVSLMDPPDRWRGRRRLPERRRVAGARRQSPAAPRHALLADHPLR